MKTTRGSVLSVLIACGGIVHAARAPRWAVAVLPSGHEFSLEVAADDASRQRGYMGREKIGPREGMIFVFDDDDRHSFWMKDCKIALDRCGSTSADGSLDRGRPPPCPRRVPSIVRQLTTFRREFAAGTVSAESLKRGDSVVVLSRSPAAMTMRGFASAAPRGRVSQLPTQRPAREPPRRPTSRPAVHEWEAHRRDRSSRPRSSVEAVRADEAPRRRGQPREQHLPPSPGAARGRAWRDLGFDPDRATSSSSRSPRGDITGMNLDAARARSSPRSASCRRRAVGIGRRPRRGILLATAWPPTNPCRSHLAHTLLDGSGLQPRDHGRLLARQRWPRGRESRRVRLLFDGGGSNRESCRRLRPRTRGGLGLAGLARLVA